MKGRPEKGPHQPIAGRRLHIPFEVYDHPAYATASHRAKDVLAAIQRQLNGWNNGKLAVSREMIAARIGSKNHSSNSKAIAELVARGLLAIEKQHPKCSRLSTEYRLTYVSTGDQKNPIPATRDYEGWKGDAATSRRPQPQPKRTKSCRSTIEQGNVVSGSTIEHDAKLSCSTIEPRRGGNNLVSGSTIEQQLNYQGRGDGGPSRPDCIPEERWFAAGRRAEISPASPPPEELRERAADYIARHGRGSQGRLGAAADIPKGTLSRFLSGALDLSNAARVRLACALPKAGKAEERREAPTTMSGRPPAQQRERGGNGAGARPGSPPVVSLTSGSRPSINSAPRTVELRTRLLRFLDTAPRGSQAKLARLADLEPSDLSRFGQGAPFTDAKRVRLARALSEAEAGALLSPPQSAAPFNPAARAAAS